MKWSWIRHTLQKRFKPTFSITHETLTYSQPAGEEEEGLARNSWRPENESELERSGTTWAEAERAAQSQVRVIHGLYSTWSEGPTASIMRIGNSWKCLQKPAPMMKLQSTETTYYWFILTMYHMSPHLGSLMFTDSEVDSSL